MAGGGVGGLSGGQGWLCGVEGPTAGLICSLWGSDSLRKKKKKKQIRWPGFNGPEVVRLSTCQSLSLLVCLQVCQVSIISHLVSHTHIPTLCPGPSDQYLTPGVDTELNRGSRQSWRRSWIELVELVLDSHSMRRKPRGGHLTWLLRANKYVTSQQLE